MFEIKVLDKKGGEVESVRCGADSCEIGSSRDGILRILAGKFRRDMHGLLEKWPVYLLKM